MTTTDTFRNHFGRINVMEMPKHALSEIENRHKEIFNIYHIEGQDCQEITVRK